RAPRRGRAASGASGGSQDRRQPPVRGNGRGAAAVAAGATSERVRRSIAVDSPSAALTMTDSGAGLETVGEIVEGLRALGLAPVMVGGMALVVLGSRRVTRD